MRAMCLINYNTFQHTNYTILIVFCIVFLKIFMHFAQTFFEYFKYIILFFKSDKKIISAARDTRGACIIHLNFLNGFLQLGADEVGSNLL